MKRIAILLLLVGCSGSSHPSSAQPDASRDASSADAARNECEIDGEFIANNGLNPSNACLSCEPAVSQTMWTALVDGTACGNEAVCSGGTCTVISLIDAGNQSNVDAATADAAPPVNAVSINFDDTASVGSEVAAGKVPTTNWNNALGDGPGQGSNGTLALEDEHGFAGGANAMWQCQDIEVTPETGSGTAGDQAMMSEGCRSWMGQGDASITLTGLATEFPNGYDVVLYIGHGGGFPTDHMATFALAVGDDSITGEVESSFDGSFVTLTGGANAGNIYVSNDHSENSLLITLAATGNATLPTAAVNGIQIFPHS